MSRSPEAAARTPSGGTSAAGFVRAGEQAARRPGGRSARVQRSVHAAVQQLLAEGRRADLSVPVVAARAGVTPSTVYRRWRSLAGLLADVAADHLRPDEPPRDTGSLRGDLRAYTRDYLEELSAPDGRAFLRDVVAGRTEAACRCAAATREVVDLLLARAAGRGESGPSAQDVLDHVIAPLVYALLLDDTTPGPARADALVDRVMGPGG